MEIEPISSSTIKLVDTVEIAQSMQAKNQTDFSSFVTDSITNVNQSIMESNEAIEALAMGKAESTHDVIIAMEEAKLSLQIAVEVRNKLVEAYHEILRMQV